MLADPLGTQPLVLQGVSILRRLSQPFRPSLSVSGATLRVLLSAAHTPPPVDVHRELQAVESALTKLANRVRIDHEAHLTPDRLQEILRRGVDIWHFVGHSTVDRSGQSCLVLEDELGDPVPFSGSQLAALLAGHQIRLVVLDACGNNGRATRSVADTLVSAGIPAVIAMQFAVPEEITRRFAAVFYQTLTEGLPIDACVTEGRRAVASMVGGLRLDWANPIIVTGDLTSLML